MTTELLIRGIVGQAAALIAQLATQQGSRAPLTQVSDQLFLDLVRELEQLGVPRKVSGQMFGLGLRTYQRKIRRVSESSTDQGRSLWEALLGYIRAQGLVMRSEIFKRFDKDDGALIGAVLRDLKESQLVFSSGKGRRASYRASTEAELVALGHDAAGDGEDELRLALMYREPAQTVEELSEHSRTEPVAVQASIERLTSSGLVERVEEPDALRYRADALTIPLGANVGWEAAILDHVKAMITTIVCRLQKRTPPALQDGVGGSTYTIDVWPGHPFEVEVLGSLGRMRGELSELRERVTEFNTSRDLPENVRRVVIYFGQSLMENDDTRVG
jgi:DNA-binding MarR family transcriptional regulator